MRTVFIIVAKDNDEEREVMSNISLTPQDIWARVPDKSLAAKLANHMQPEAPVVICTPNFTSIYQRVMGDV